MKNLVITENDSKTFEATMKQEMDKSIKHFEGELIKIRTGRAHTSLIENVMVSCYGQAPMPLKNVAAIAAPESRLLTVQPWDITVIPDIERAINASEIGVAPVNDGKIIRIQLPEVSSSRRDELVKILHKKLEDCRIAIRNARKDFNNLLRDTKKDKKISENFFNRLSDLMQKVTDNYITQAEQMAAKKEKDITTI